MGRPDGDLVTSIGMASATTSAALRVFAGILKITCNRFIAMRLRRLWSR
jgi:hypothetical protein